MGGLKTLSAIAMLSAGPASAAGEVEMLMAECAGRSRAAAEEAWLYGGPPADLAERRWRSFTDLTRALDSTVATRARVVEARAAHRLLLASARQDQAAALLALRAIAACDALLPGS